MISRRRLNVVSTVCNLVKRRFSSKKMEGQACRKGIRLDSLPRDEVKKWLASIDTVLTDCDGVLWLYTDIIGEAPKVINRFKAMRKDVFFVTNNSTKTRDEFLEKAHLMGFKINRDDIISPSYLAAQYLHSLKFKKEVYVIGSTGIAKELDNVGIKNHGVGPDVVEHGLQKFIHEELKLNPNVGAVIVGFDEYFNYKKMILACSYLDNKDCIFIGTNTDERFPTPECIIPGTGCLVRCIETGAERNAIVMGKPHPYAFEVLKRTHSIDPSRTLMIGDRCNTDILLGTNCGFKTLLVETGIHNESDVRKWQKSGTDEEKKLIPDFILPSLGDLFPYMTDD